MKNDFLRALKKHAVWFLLFMGLNLLYALALWLSESEAFLRLWLVIALGSLLIFLTALFFVCRVEKGHIIFENGTTLKGCFTVTYRRKE